MGKVYIPKHLIYSFQTALQIKLKNAPFLVGLQVIQVMSTERHR